MLSADSTETQGLLDKARQGDPAAVECLLSRHRAELHAFVAVRLDPRIRARVDPSDVVQETQMIVARRLSDFLKRRPMPFHLWVRKTAYQRLLNLRRDHRVTVRRSVDREQALLDRSSLLLARPVLAGSADRRAADRESAERVGRAVERLSEADREILLMRHVDELSYAEVSCLLEIDAAAARKRYGRALLRLRRVLADDGLLEDRT